MVESEDGVSIFNVYADGTLLPTLPCGRFRYITKQVSKNEISDAVNELTGHEAVFEASIEVEQVGDEGTVLSSRYLNLLSGQTYSNEYDPYHFASSRDPWVLPESSTGESVYYGKTHNDYQSAQTEVVYYVTYLANCKGEIIQPLRAYYQIFSTSSEWREHDEKPPKMSNFWDTWNRVFDGMSIGIHIGHDVRPVVSIGGYDVFETMSGAIGAVDLRMGSPVVVGQEPPMELLDYVNFAIDMKPYEPEVSDEYRVVSIEFIGPSDPDPKPGSDEVLIKFPTLSSASESHSLSNLSERDSSTRADLSIKESIKGKVETRSRFVRTTGSAGVQQQLPNRYWVKHPGSDEWIAISTSQWKDLMQAEGIDVTERWHNGKKIPVQ